MTRQETTSVLLRRALTSTADLFVGLGIVVIAIGAIWAETPAGLPGVLVTIGKVVVIVGIAFDLGALAVRVNAWRRRRAA